MSVILKYKLMTLETETVIWDRDSFFIDFNNYWSRLAACIAQKIAERTTDNWNKFNLIRNNTIKSLGINLETGLFEDYSSPINILPVNIFSSLLVSNLRLHYPDKKLSELNELLDELVNLALKESKDYIKKSILFENLELIKRINNNAKQILITNDTSENNNSFIEESGIKNCFQEIRSEVNKRLLNEMDLNHSIFLTKNEFLEGFLKKKNFNNVLNISDQKLLSITGNTDTTLVTINIDGASRGNPGPASIGIVFYKTNDLIKEVSEFIGTQTNNFAEYTALIRALEVSVNNSYKNIEIRSDSELVVKQMNKKYKVKDPDIKILFDKANDLLQNINSFKIIHVPREENLKADKLANNALKELN